MADEVILLDNRASPFAARVRIALREKGLEWELREEDVTNKSPLLLEMNPVMKQVPVLIHNGIPICESLLILQYIDEVWPHKSPLLPSHPFLRARARFWADFVDKKIHGLVKLAWFSTGEAQEAAKKELIGSFKLMEEELWDNPYFGGDTFGFVDAALLPFSNLFFFLTCNSGSGNSGGNSGGASSGNSSSNLVVSTECPKIAAWARRCMEKESVSKSLPDPFKLSHFFTEVNKKKLRNK